MKKCEYCKNNIEGKCKINGYFCSTVDQFPYVCNEKFIYKLPKETQSEKK